MRSERCVGDGLADLLVQLGGLVHGQGHAVWQEDHDLAAVGDGRAEVDDGIAAADGKQERGDKFGRQGGSSGQQSGHHTQGPGLVVGREIAPQRAKYNGMPWCQ